MVSISSFHPTTTATTAEKLAFFLSTGVVVSASAVSIRTVDFMDLVPWVQNRPTAVLLD